MGDTIHISFQGSQGNPPHGASSSMCQFVPGNSLPVMPFQGYLVTHPPPPSLPMGPPGTTYNVVATGFLQSNPWSLRLLYLLGILSVTWIFLLIAELRVGKVQVGKLEGNTRSHRNCRRALFSNGWCSCQGCFRWCCLYWYTWPKVAICQAITSWCVCALL